MVLLHRPEICLPPAPLTGGRETSNRVLSKWRNMAIYPVKGKKWRSSLSESNQHFCRWTERYCRESQRRSNWWCNRGGTKKLLKNVRIKS